MAGGMSDAALDALAKETFDWYIRWNPAFATHVGIHEFDHLMPRGSYEAQMEALAKAKDVLQRLEAMERKSLSPGKRVDYGVLRNTLRVYIFETEELRIWESMPQAPDTVGAALFPLFMRDFAPLARRMASITTRLEATPKYVEESKTQLRSPVKAWTEVGRQSAEHFPGFLQLIRAAGAGALPPADLSRLDEAIAKVTEAFGRYVSWIDRAVLPKAKERTGIGGTKLSKLLRIRELGLTADEIYAIGKRYLRQSKAARARLAGAIKPGASVQEAKDIVKGDHPVRFEDALAFTAKAMGDAKRFILEHDLATIPPNEVLRVVETPEYLRHVLPFAAYVMPGRFEAKQEGFYMVTPVEDKPEMLREHAYAFTRNTAVHEGYPGHHLQLTCANLNPSYARALTGATETVEGWAHYCEDMMKETGFSGDPATKFAQMTDQIWRACRIIIDIDLHRGKMTFDEAVDFLVNETGMERPGAVGEVRRYTYTPGYQLSYLLGKHLILQLQKDVKKALGRGYSDKFFHDTILYAGSLPMKHIREIFDYKLKELRKLRRKGL